MRKEKGKEVAPEVIYEDNFLLVLDKPSDWIVNEANTAKGQKTVQAFISQNFHFSLARSIPYRSGIVHRLDKETSGVLLIAKDAGTFERLQSLFKDRKVKKGYVALLHGRMKDKKGTIEAEVGRLPWNRRRFGVLPGGRDSKTSYSVVSEYEKSGQFYSLVDFFPETGRTHQIRIHAKHIGHPVVGDTFYAGRKTARKDRKWCPRLFLHANSIGFIHLGREVVYKSSLPDDLSSSLNLLEKPRTTQ